MAREHDPAECDLEGRQGVRFGLLQTPIGCVFVGVSDRGVCGVALDNPGKDGFRRRLAQRGFAAQYEPAALAAALSEFDAYFQGCLKCFTLPVDFRSASTFTRRVLAAARRIRFGAVSSYGEVARRIGAPRASRAVGAALGRNPVPVIVPCHRVLTHSGRLGGFTGGIDTKRALLAIEGHVVSE